MTLLRRMYDPIGNFGEQIRVLQEEIRIVGQQIEKVREQIGTCSTLDKEAHLRRVEELQGELHRREEKNLREQILQDREGCTEFDWPTQDLPSSDFGRLSKTPSTTQKERKSCTWMSLHFLGKSVMLHRMAMAFRSRPFVLVFVLLLLPLSGLPVWGAHEDDLPGWMGESHMSRDHSEGEGIQQVARRDPTCVIHLSWKPRAFLHKNFLTDAECEHMIELAKDKLEKSMVADNESGKSVASEIRTSSGMFLMKGQDDVISRIEDKIATWTFLPKENGEAIQVLRYQDGEKYEPHFDYFHDKNNQALGGHRIATVLMYLSDVVKGGETVFPSSEDRGGVKDETWSPCGKTGLAVKPRKGDALLFFSLHPSAVPDESSLHTGCPVLEGEKWSATKWIHVLPFEKPRPKNGACVNEDEKCEEWAAYGECQKNPAYMVGTKEWPGFCRKACKLC